MSGEPQMLVEAAPSRCGSGHDSDGEWSCGMESETLCSELGYLFATRLV